MNFPSLYSAHQDIEGKERKTVDLPQKELSIDKNNKFKLNYIISEDKKDVVKGLLAAVKSAGAENVYLATDPDREGEAISYHLCRNLNLDYKTAKRVTFQEITKTAVQDAVKKPRLIDIPLVSAQEAIRVLGFFSLKR